MFELDKTLKQPKIKSLKKFLRTNKLANLLGLIFLTIVMTTIIYRISMKL